VRACARVCDKEELLDQWKESIIVPVHKKGDKTDCSNYLVLSLLSTLYKILSNILLSRLSHMVSNTDYFCPVAWCLIQMEVKVKVKVKVCTGIICVHQCFVQLRITFS
jgi:hypothetical protein